MADSSKLRKRLRRLECVICLELFKDPRVLPCPSGIHTVCKGCVTSLIEGKVLKCPICRAQHIVPKNGGDGFLRNPAIQEQLDDICKSCGKMEHDVRCEHCDRDVCTHCREVHLSVSDANKRRDKLVDLLKQGKFIANKQNADNLLVHKETSFVMAKRKQQLHDQADSTLLELNDWRKSLRKVVAVYEHYINNSAINMHDFTKGNKTLTDLKTVTERDVEMSDNILSKLRSEPRKPEPVLAYGTRGGMAAVEAFGQIIDPGTWRPDTSENHSENDKKIDECRAEATFQFHITNISKLKDQALSPPYYVRNLPWNILAMPRYNKLNQKSLAYFLQCNKDAEYTSWSCYASAELRIIVHKTEGKTFSKDIQHLFNSKENDFGFSHFIAWNELLDSARGLIKDDSITLEVHVKADAPRSVKEM